MISRKRLGHPHFRNAARIVVALRDWGPLHFDDLLADTELPPRQLAGALFKLRSIGYVRRRRHGMWAIGKAGEATAGGLRFFGFPARRSA